MVSVYKHGLSIGITVVFPGVCLNVRLWHLDLVNKVKIVVERRAHTEAESIVKRKQGNARYAGDKHP